jgi:hypothetical protein
MTMTELFFQPVLPLGLPLYCRAAVPARRQEDRDV